MAKRPMLTGAKIEVLITFVVDGKVRSQLAAQHGIEHAQIIDGIYGVGAESDLIELNNQIGGGMSSGDGIGSQDNIDLAPYKG